MSLIHIHLFGTPQVDKDSQTILVPRRKTLALLAYMAVNCDMQSREALATLFWPEYDQSSALANLRRELSRLKELLGEKVLAIDRLNVGFASQVEVALDVAAFGALVKKVKLHHRIGENLCGECIRALQEAVEIYRADFMAGFNLPDSPGFDEWVFFHGEELRKLLAEALQRLIDWHISRAEYEQGISYARRWLSLDRLHEPVHRLLIQLYAWAGQQAAAVRQYQECHRILQEELGIEPEEETQAIYEAVKLRTLKPPELPAGSPQVTKASEELIVGQQPSQEERSSQTIRFCVTPGGVRLAYATTGQGPVLVKTANWLSHLEYDWNSPVWRHWLTALSMNNTLVRYDERGCGLSDWNVNEFTLDAWVQDLETVVDALGLNKFPLLGLSQGAAIAVEYAVRHPEKVSRLILYGGYIRGRFHRQLTSEQLEEQEVLLRLIRVGWGKEHPAFRQVFSTLFLPEGTPEQFEAFNELQRISSSPDIAARIVRGFQEIDVTEQARRITQPTLVLHAREDLRIPFEEGRLMAATIPNARLVILEGKNHILLEDEPAWTRFLDEVNSFLQEDER